MRRSTTCTAKTCKLQKSNGKGKMWESKKASCVFIIVCVRFKSGQAQFSHHSLHGFGGTSSSSCLSCKGGKLPSLSADVVQLFIRFTNSGLVKNTYVTWSNNRQTQTSVAAPEVFRWMDFQRACFRCPWRASSSAGILSRSGLTALRWLHQCIQRGANPDVSPPPTRDGAHEATAGTSPWLGQAAVFYQC